MRKNADVVAYPPVSVVPVYLVSRCPVVIPIVFLLVLSMMFPYAYASGEPYVFGYVTDVNNAPVGNALVSFVPADGNASVLSGKTDAAGRYEIDTALAVKNSAEATPLPFGLRQNFPNPFNPATTIPVDVNEAQHLTVEVFNMLGQRVRTLARGTFQPGAHQLSWDGLDDAGQSLAAGVYVLRVRSPRHTGMIKMLMIDGGGGHSFPAALRPAVMAEKRTESHIYTVVITSDAIERFEQAGVVVVPGIQLDFTVERLNYLPFKTMGDYLAVYGDGEYVPLFIKGVNMGVGIPGRHPGELAPTREQYRHWFERIGECGFNCLRIYTLHYPRFYEEFAAYNLSHHDLPLYLFQGIWLDEEYSGSDLYGVSAEFDDEIRAVIDCVHGNNEIGHRFGKAYGTYEHDVFPWVIGFIIGREISPHEVIATNELHGGVTSYTGDAVSLDDGTPAEVWAARRIDMTITYERNGYDVQRPVSMSSWPTLDPLVHPTEPPESFEDVAVIDLAHLDDTNAPGGYFVSYHAYPYYPNFMNEEPEYHVFRDEYGVNNYLGYLTDLKRHYSSKPLIIAEYGVPSSWGNAHDSVSGMHHGGLDEQEQGRYNVRMLNNIHQTNCGGGMLFALFDEWFKNSWITAPLGPDHERRPLFHNVTGPEQNYGLIAFETGTPDFEHWPETRGQGRVERIRAAYDNAFFHLEVTLDHAVSPEDTVVIGYDTYRAALGESVLPDGAVVTQRAELALVISGDAAQLYVTEAYDLFGIWHGVSGSRQLYRSVPADGAPWAAVRWKNGLKDGNVQHIGSLRLRTASEPETSRDAVVIDDNRLEIRIPWTLLQFTDPSLRLVMHDDRSTVEREEMESDGIAVTVSAGGDMLEAGRFLWDVWNIAPVTSERDKASFGIVREGLNHIPDTPGFPVVTALSDW